MMPKVVAAMSRGVVGVGDPLRGGHGGYEDLGVGVQGRVGDAPVAGVRREAATGVSWPAAAGFVSVAWTSGANMVESLAAWVNSAATITLVLGDGSLGAVALHESVAGSEHPAVGIGRVRLCLAFLLCGRGLRPRRRRPVAFSLAAPLGLAALPVRRPLYLELTQRLGQTGSPIPASSPPAGEFPAPARTDLGVFGRVDAVRLGQDLRRELLAGAIRPRRRVGLDLGRVDRHHPLATSPSDTTQRQHLGEQPGDRRLMASPKAGQRGVIGLLIRPHHPERHVIHETPLDPPRGALTHATGVDEHRQDHRRVL